MGSWNFCSGEKKPNRYPNKIVGKNKFKIKKNEKSNFFFSIYANRFVCFWKTNAVVTPKAATTEVVKSKINSFAELEEALKDNNFSISEIKYDDANLICGFTLSYDDGVRSWDTWMDCSDWGSDGLWNLVQFLLYYY